MLGERSDQRGLWESAKARGIRLKVNTVVNRHNVDEDFRSFIRATGPERWKIFQALPVEGQNDLHFDDFAITQDIERKGDDGVRSLRGPEPVDRGGTAGRHHRGPREQRGDDAGSYLMIDPRGCFFDNTKGELTYSSPTRSHSGCAGGHGRAQIGPTGPVGHSPVPLLRTRQDAIPAVPGGYRLWRRSDSVGGGLPRHRAVLSAVPSDVQAVSHGVVAHATAIFGAVRLGLLWSQILFAPALLPKSLSPSRAFRPGF